MRRWLVHKWVVVVALVVLVASAAVVGLWLLKSDANPAQFRRAGHSCVIAGVEFVAVPGGEFAMGDDSDLAEPERAAGPHRHARRLLDGEDRLTLTHWMRSSPHPASPRSITGAKRRSPSGQHHLGRRQGVLRLVLHDLWGCNAATIGGRMGTRGTRRPHRLAVPQRRFHLAPGCQLCKRWSSEGGDLSAEWLRPLRHGGQRL